MRKVSIHPVTLLEACSLRAGTGVARCLAAVRSWMVMYRYERSELTMHGRPGIMA